MTLNYASPELIETRRFTLNSDLWALGILIYELMFGTCPYQSES